MSTENQAQDGYGYQDDDVPSGGSSLSLGLNQGIAKLTKFEWIPNGGADGAEMEALDIEFTVEGRDKPLKYRKFPVTKAFEKDTNKEITDPNHPAMKDAKAELSQVITHILGCFVDKDAIKAAFSKPITSFKDYVKTAEGLLPAGYQEIPLDIFMQYQWAIKGDNNRTYLELPKNMKQGKFLAKGTTNDWKEVKTSKSLRYVDSTDEKVIHPFQRSEWWLASNFAIQQKDGADQGGASHDQGGGSASAW